MLKDRLRKLVDCIENKNVVADIGCDHGFVCKAILDEKRAKHVIGCDISKYSLEKTDILLKNYENAQTRLCDGLDGLKLFEADSIIIAGMGGYLISEILNANLEIALNVQNLILLPHNNENVLRKFLCKKGFYIYEEHIVKENRYYQIICSCKGKSDYDKEIYYHIGKRLFEKKENEFIEFKKNVFNKIITNARCGKNAGVQVEYYRKLEGEICTLQKSAN